MNHPLTDQILQQIAEDPLDGLVGGTFVKEYMRAAYDLGWKNAKDQDKAYIRQAYKQGYNDAKKEVKDVLSHTKELEELQEL